MDDFSDLQSTDLSEFRYVFFFLQQDKQQQQHSILSQINWGRLKMKPKRDEKQGHIKGHKGHKTKKGHSSDTLIVNLQALLSITKSLKIFHSLRSLLTDLSQVSLGRPLYIIGPL
jgi:hypothetical protein